MLFYVREKQRFWKILKFLHSFLNINEVTKIQKQITRQLFFLEIIHEKTILIYA